jgi:hypothetical protein
MAKVMVSMPDELLHWVDAEAERRGLTRSAMLREFATAAQDDRRRRLAERMRELDAMETRGHGGTGLELLKAGRKR